MRVFAGIYFWVMAIAVTGVAFVLTWAAHTLERFLPSFAAGRGVHRAAALWGRTIIRLMPGWSVEVQGREHLPRGTDAMVVVANHESMADICAIYHLGLQFRWLAKDSVFRLPCVGPAMRWAGYVPVKRGSRESSASAIRTSAACIRKGLSMFYFPEGTRSEDGVIKDFKLGAFKLAQDEQAPMLPIAISGAANLLPKHSWIPGRARVKLIVLPLVAAPAPTENLEAYAAKIRRQIIDAHAALV